MGGSIFRTMKVCYLVILLLLITVVNRAGAGYYESNSSVSNFANVSGPRVRSIVRMKPSHQPEFDKNEVWSMKKYIMENMIASFKKIFKELTILKQKFILYTTVRTSAT